MLPPRGRGMSRSSTHTMTACWLGPFSWHLAIDFLLNGSGNWLLSLKVGSSLVVGAAFNGAAIASVMLMRYKTRRGRELERLGATYVLRKTGGGWKISVIVLHESSNVLKLE